MQTIQCYIRISASLCRIFFFFSLERGEFVDRMKTSFVFKIEAGLHQELLLCSFPWLPRISPRSPVLSKMSLRQILGAPVVLFRIKVAEIAETSSFVEIHMSA